MPVLYGLSLDRIVCARYWIGLLPAVHPAPLGSNRIVLVWSVQNWRWPDMPIVIGVPVSV